MKEENTLQLVKAVENLERTSPNGVTFDVLKKFAVAIEARLGNPNLNALKG